jgi:hypothetical protein
LQVFVEFTRTHGRRNFIERAKRDSGSFNEEYAIPTLLVERQQYIEKYLHGYKKKVEYLFFSFFVFPSASKDPSQTSFSI